MQFFSSRIMITIIVRRVYKFLKASLFSILSVVVIYFVFALLFSIIRTIPHEQTCSPTIEIFIASNGVHLDIILPVENIDPEFQKELKILNNTKFVAFGWGDKDFYINTPEWSDLTFCTAFKALFLKSKTAMHVTCFQSSSQSWRCLKLCKSQSDLLNKYIENSFAKTENGNLIKLDVEGYSNFDCFFEAKGSFSFYKTCNIWVNKALKEIGVSTSVWSPFEFGILYHLPA